MVIGHIVVEEIFMIPANDSRVSAHSNKAVLDVMWGDGIEGTTDVEKGRETVRFCIYMAFDVVCKSGGSSLSRSVASETM